MGQMVKDCSELVEKKMKKELTPEEYYIGLMELHRKYPLKCSPNFYDAAQIYSKNIKAVEKPKEKVEIKERPRYADD